MLVKFARCVADVARSIAKSARLIANIARCIAASARPIASDARYIVDSARRLAEVARRIVDTARRRKVSTITKQPFAKFSDLIVSVVKFVVMKEEAKKCFRLCVAKKYAVVNFEKKILTFCRTMSNM
ncbi:MAG: hypothetical protein M0Q21_06835 [Ignavibacteriaceae bacterium]|nr:hypothetical protein [Ignavibacteriaceae bacterium]